MDVCVGGGVVVVGREEMEASGAKFEITLFHL